MRRRIGRRRRWIRLARKPPRAVRKRFRVVDAAGRTCARVTTACAWHGMTGAPPTFTCGCGCCVLRASEVGRRAGGDGLRVTSAKGTAAWGLAREGPDGPCEAGMGAVTVFATRTEHTGGSGWQQHCARGNSARGMAPGLTGCSTLSAWSSTATQPATASFRLSNTPPHSTSGGKMLCTSSACIVSGVCLQSFRPTALAAAGWSNCS